MSQSERGKSELEKKLAKIEATLGLEPMQDARLAAINVYPVTVYYRC